ncbi:Fic family protein [Bradyrhizobium sp. CCBAU 45394]|uniref:Fic family protein n=1 Tax=Bradyrhizobium sp. CCBAU 45394 TaxID=1325087 RepID=UPI003FA4642F
MTLGQSLTAENGEQSVNQAARFLAVLNAIHPFREGNGRTQSVFMSMVGEHAGFPSCAMIRDAAGPTLRWSSRTLFQRTTNFRFCGRYLGRHAVTCRSQQCSYHAAGSTQQG